MTTETPSSFFDTSSEAQQARSRKARRTGSRAKLAQRFFEDTYAAWEEQGPSVLARAAFHDPVAFANMVARLMPQKIEVSTPTDGMSDERLAEMLEFAERMAGLKAEHAKVLQGSVAFLPSTAHNLIDENGASALTQEGRGGGPLREEGGGGKKTASTQRADPAENATPEFKALNLPQDGAALTPQSTDATAAETPLPYPVGRPFVKPDHEVERENRRALARDEDIDPASLF